MANTYSQIYMHIVFSVKGRASLIQPSFEDELYRYICGVCRNHKHTVIVINGTTDHIHMLISMHPSESASELVRSIKVETSKWLHEKKAIRGFAWQNGFAAFSYSKTFLPKVEHYIANQKEHHRKRTFQEEIEDIFNLAGIEYEKKYLMQGMEDS